MRPAAFLLLFCLLLQTVVQNVEGHSFGLLLGSNLAIHKSKASNKKAEKRIKQKKPKTNKAISEKKTKIRVVPAELTTAERATITRRQQIFTTIQQLVLSLLSMYASRIIYKIDYKQSNNIFVARVVFTVYILFSLLLGWFLRHMVAKHDDETLLPNPTIAGAAGGPLGGLLGQLSGSGGNGDADAPQTVKEHDLKAITEMNRSIIFEMVAAIYLHFTNSYKFMLMLPMMGLVSKLKNPIVMLHLYGMHPVGDLERPFKNPMQKMVENMSGQSNVVKKIDDEDEEEEEEEGLEIMEETEEDYYENDDEEYYEEEEEEEEYEEEEQMMEEEEEDGMMEEDEEQEGEEVEDEEAELMEAMEAIMNLADSLEDGDGF